LIHLSNRLNELVKKFTDARQYSLFVALDEAQVLLSILSNSFNSSRSGEPRSLFSKFLYSWMKYIGLFIAVAGTGLKLGDAIKYVASPAMKTESIFRAKLLFTKFGIYDTPEKLGKYLQPYLGKLNVRTLEKILQLVEGRYRFSAYFLNLLLKEDLSTNKEGIIDRSLERMKMEPTLITLEPTSFMSILKDMEKIPYIGDSKESPIQIVRKLTLHYYLLGTKKAFRDEDVIELVEYAICPLSRDKANSIIASFCEPYTAWCCYNYFKRTNPINNEILEIIGDFYQNPPVRGLLIEHFILPAIIKYFSQKPSIHLHDYFKAPELFNNLPQWFVGMTFSVKLDPQMPIKRSSKEYNLIDWLKNSECYSTSFVPENIAKSDAVTPLHNIYNQDHRASIIQFKFYSKTIIYDKLKKALNTTNYKKAYTYGDYETEKTKQCIELFEQKYAADKGTLRIVFYYPNTSDDVIQKLPTSVEGNDVIIWLNKNSTPELFGSDSEKVWRFLRSITFQNK